MRVMDLTGSAARLSVDIETSLPADLLMSLLALSADHAGTLEIPERFGIQTSEFSPRLRAALETVGTSGGELWGNLVGLALLEPAARDVNSFIERLEGLSAKELWMTLAGAQVAPIVNAVGRDVFDRAAGGDPEARRELFTAHPFCDEEHLSWWAGGLLDMGVDGAKEALLDVLRRWHEEVYRPLEARTAEVLDRDGRAKRNLADTVTLEKLIEVATNGIEFRAEPWVRRVILVPHVSLRPWNVMGGHGDAYILCYPAADESFGEDPSTPPAALVRLHRALGDEKRLRMLKVLSGGSATLQELADATGLAKSSAHHHLVILRAAGLVLVTSDYPGRYSLRRDSLPGAEAMLQAFLAEPSS